MALNQSSTPPRLLVTGTDTAVGKTHVTRGIARSIHRLGFIVRALKPIETGCPETLHGTDSVDGLSIARAARHEHLLERTAPLRFPLPASPRAAAAAIGQTLAFDEIANLIRRAETGVNASVIEGSGGLLAPISPEGTFAELAVRLHARVLIVARDALGTINHVALTVEALHRRNIPIAAVVLNAAGSVPQPLNHQKQLQTILPQLPVIGPLPWTIASSTDDDIAQQLADAAGSPRGLLSLCFPTLLDSLPEPRR
jgi:dethiobiotin synthetase